MSRRVPFEDGSVLDVSANIVTEGKMATAAYRKLMEFIEDELVDNPNANDEDLSDLDDEDFEELDDKDDDDDDLDDLSLDDIDDWDDDDEFDDGWR